MQCLLQAPSKESRQLVLKTPKLPNGFQDKGERLWAHSQLMNILLIGWWWGNWGVNIINLLGVGVYVLVVSKQLISSTWWEWKYLQKAQKITGSPWGGTKSPWLCLMAKLLLLPCLTVFLYFYIFSILWLNLFFRTWGKPRKPKFSTDKRLLEDMGWGWGVVCPGKSPKGPTRLHPQFIR